MSRTRWTAEAIVDVIHAWAAEHGEPPRMREWRAAGEGRPTASRVQQAFGSWSAAMRAAGVEARASCRPVFWTRELVISAMRAWVEEHGRAPTSKEWDRVDRGGAPGRDTVCRLFGSWQAGISAAGLVRVADHLGVRCEHAGCAGWATRWVRFGDGSARFAKLTRVAYCDDHTTVVLDQFKARVVPDDRCVAIRQNGQRCALRAGDGVSFCHRHAGMAGHGSYDRGVSISPVAELHPETELVAA